MSDTTLISPTDSGLLAPIRTANQLHDWIRLFVGADVPRAAVCAHHQAPFEYVKHAYFEPTKDVIVWAPRGGGKTRLAAIATLLDLLHKPHIAVRILGGSLDQSMRMWEYLLPDVQRLAEKQIVKQAGGARRLHLTTGAHAAVLTQSQRAVRGLRVQKLRCDEVEMFNREVWEAAQLVTRSDHGICGAIDALSTAHRPFGLMSEVIDSAHKSGTKVIHWCLLEVLERCPPERECRTCPLWDECRGVAKTRCDGFFRIDDAIAMKRRVSVETWLSEVMCKRPMQRDCVFPSFDPALHVIDVDPEGSADSLAMDFGFANPLVCLWIESRADGTTFVFDEYVQPQRTINEHLDHIESRRWGAIKTVACDPAGAARSGHSGVSDIQVLKSRGYKVRSRSSQIVSGIDMIRAALRPAHGAPRLFVHRRCARLIKALQAYRYANNGSEMPLKDGEHDHLIDALRYYFVNAKTDGAIVRSY